MHPFLSSIGIVLTLVLLAGLLGYVLLKGGTAFSPGKLSAQSYPGVDLGGFSSHADFENRCSLCHAPLATTQDQLCLNCHQRVALQIDSEVGTHSNIDQVSWCTGCHTDHKGRDHDLNQEALVRFDHSSTSFSLVRHQVDYRTLTISCTDCHADQIGFSVVQANCIACHGDHDVLFMLTHIQEFGQRCVECHDGQDGMANFDHQETAFPLQELHQQVTCTECHQLDRHASGQEETGEGAELVQLRAGLASDRPDFTLFAGAPEDCVGCHAEPAIHAGTFSSDCQTCHTPRGWMPADLEGSPFEHTARSGFSLARHKRDAQGSPMACSSCHARDLRNFDIEVCIDCHSQGEQGAAFIPAHQEQFGASCLECHDGADRMHGFEHAWVFPLEGRHAEIDCAACHIEKAFAGTPNECVQCHSEPELHAGFFGLRCQYCHTAQAWVPARLSLHAFPIDHGGLAQDACQSCHGSKYAEYTCYGCHDHQPEEIFESHTRAGVSLEELPDCAGCHPAGLKDGT